MREVSDARLVSSSPYIVFNCASDGFMNLYRGKLELWRGTFDSPIENIMFSFLPLKNPRQLIRGKIRFLRLKLGLLLLRGLYCDYLQLCFCGDQLSPASRVAGLPFFVR